MNVFRMSDERNLLLARLAAERARLLRELIGISAADVTGAPVFADWTASNLLAHIGDYDQLFAERIRHALDGRADSVVSIENLDARNEALHQRIKDWSVELSVAYLVDARVALIDAVSRVNDADLRRVRRFSWGRVAIQTWVNWRHRHDYGHAKDLRAWRATLEHTDVAGSKAVMLAALRSARDDLLASAALVPEAERATRPVCGVWTLKDVVGHLADWDRWFLNCVYAMIGGPAQDLDWPDDEHVINGRIYVARRDRPWEWNWSDCREARRALTEALERIPEDVWKQQYTDRSPFPTLYHCAWSALEHYLDHAAVLRAELPVAMPKRLLHFKGLYT
jgi:uncharacterized damage-inducible protein DinB